MKCVESEFQSESSYLINFKYFQCYCNNVKNNTILANHNPIHNRFHRLVDKTLHIKISFRWQLAQFNLSIQYIKFA